MNKDLKVTLLYFCLLIGIVILINVIAHFIIQYSINQALGCQQYYSNCTNGGPCGFC